MSVARERFTTQGLMDAWARHGEWRHPESPWYTSVEVMSERAAYPALPMLVNGVGLAPDSHVAVLTLRAGSQEGRTVAVWRFGLDDVIPALDALLEWEQKWGPAESIAYGLIEVERWVWDRVMGRV